MGWHTKPVFYPQLEPEKCSEKSSKFTGWSINSIWNTFSVFEAPPILTLTLQISEGKGGTIQRHSEGMWSFLKPLKYLYSWVKLTYRQRLGSHSHSKVLIVMKAEGISSGSAGCPRAFAFISSIKSTIALANGTGYSLSDGRCWRDVRNPSKYRSKNWKQFQNYIYIQLMVILVWDWQQSLLFYFLYKDLRLFQLLGPFEAQLSIPITVFLTRNRFVITWNCWHLKLSTVNLQHCWRIGICIVTLCRSCSVVTHPPMYTSHLGTGFYPRIQLASIIYIMTFLD